MKNKYYYLYKITNQLNGKIYIGVHQTYNMDDDYMGSGTLLKRAQKKYGIENFTKEVLQQFNNENNMFNEEAILVDREFVLREDTYNLTEGGTGKFPYEYQSINGKKGGPKGGKISWEQKLGWFSENSRKKNHQYMISEKNLSMLLENSKKIATSEEIKAKRKATMKKNNHQQGKNNSQYGKMWITDGKESKKIMKDDEIPSGWRKGRKQK